MGTAETKSNDKEVSIEIKQTFLSNAITDISTYIQLADTKVSIIMASLVAIVAGFLACYDPIYTSFSGIAPCSILGVLILLFSLLCAASIISVFIFGILTIRGHTSKIGYKSKWFLSQPLKAYSFDKYKQDLKDMKNEDIIENMVAELYKLNDINQQKAKTMKWAIRSFSISLIAIAAIGVLLLINAL